MPFRVTEFSASFYLTFQQHNIALRYRSKTKARELARLNWNLDCFLSKEGSWKSGVPVGQKLLGAE